MVFCFGAILKWGLFLCVPVRETLAVLDFVVYVYGSTTQRLVNKWGILKLSVVASCLLFSQFEFVFIANAFCGRHLFDIHFNQTILRYFCFYMAFIVVSALVLFFWFISATVSDNLPAGLFTLSLSRTYSLDMIACHEF